MKADAQSEPVSFEGEIDGLSGELPAGDVYIVASRYHRAACDSMTQAAIDSLLAAGLNADSIHVARVPGAWELPLAVQVALDLPETIGVVAIGVVIRGETSHDEHINRAVSLELMRLGSEYSRPVGLALLTCNDEQQVAARTGGELGNKGTEAAQAVVEMLRLIQKIEQV
ncbi:MAG TPA: 6,7-dimethyl-8-ribityllumazine synthase [Planctomycetaceae bacterium]|nr:6,7-dimethyl-8-ribityllumazine synthase [Planctomycetaceae bacterium]